MWIVSLHFLGSQYANLSVCGCQTHLFVLEFKKGSICPHGDTNEAVKLAVNTKQAEKDKKFVFYVWQRVTWDYKWIHTTHASQCVYCCHRNSHVKPGHLGSAQACSAFKLGNQKIQEMKARSETCRDKLLKLKKTLYSFLFCDCYSCPLCYFNCKLDSSNIWSDHLIIFWLQNKLWFAQTQRFGGRKSSFLQSKKKEQSASQAANKRKADVR